MRDKALLRAAAEEQDVVHDVINAGVFVPPPLPRELLSTTKNRKVPRGGPRHGPPALIIPLAPASSQIRGPDYETNRVTLIMKRT